MTSTRLSDTTRVALPVATAAVTAAVAVLIRDRYDFEDTRAFVTLGAACAAAAFGAAGIALALQADRRSCLVYGLTAAALVTPLIAFIYFVRMVFTADYS